MMIVLLKKLDIICGLHVVDRRGFDMSCQEIGTRS